MVTYIIRFTCDGHIWSHTWFALHMTIIYEIIYDCKNLQWSYMIQYVISHIWFYNADHIWFTIQIIYDPFSTIYDLKWCLYMIPYMTQIRSYMIKLDDHIQALIWSYVSTYDLKLRVDIWFETDIWWPYMIWSTYDPIYGR